MPAVGETIVCKDENIGEAGSQSDQGNLGQMLERRKDMRVPWGET